MARPGKYTLLALLPALLVAVTGLSFFFAGTTAGPSVSLLAETDKDSYAIGEDIIVTLYFVNSGDTEATFPSLSYRLDIEGLSGAVLLLDVDEVRQSEVTIPPSSAVLIDSYIWDQEDYDSNQVSPGQYTVHSSLFDYVLAGETAFQIG